MLARFRSRVRRTLLDRLLRERFFFAVEGHCPCCERPVEFVANHPWLRDHFVCDNCHSIPRQRALLKVLQDEFPGWRDAAIHESSPSDGGASGRLRSDCRDYLSSQYFPDHPFGETVFEHRNENLERMTFPDERFDLVITQDVMEHIFDTDAAFREIARTLKPGGAHVFTVPLVNKHEPSRVWAVRNPDGSPRFLYEPDYHGNPVDPRGAPVTMRWGYDIVQRIEDACGLKTAIVTIDDLSKGIAPTTSRCSSPRSRCVDARRGRRTGHPVGFERIGRTSTSRPVHLRGGEPGFDMCSSRTRICGRSTSPSGWMFMK